ncbi:hypothetical protein [Candidatus Palauibacter sp.]|uniref:hypothetical protein n=1 Tax=Candidatus Palauibacter sp. TaxID=3101350 RepID=UPI003AF1F539
MPALILQACDSGAARVGTLHSDSAGVAIATALEPVWEPGEGWIVGDEPLVEIGTAFGASEYQLDGVVGVVRLGKGYEFGKGPIFAAEAGRLTVAAPEAYVV